MPNSASTWCLLVIQACQNSNTQEPVLNGKRRYELSVKDALSACLILQWKGDGRMFQPKLLLVASTPILPRDTISILFKHTLK